MSDKKIIDISPIISNKTAVFPGDTPFTRKVLMDFPKGDHIGLSTINSTVHIGAHTDAPNHYDKDGCDMASRDLHFYMGDCQVIEVSLARGERILLKHIKDETINAHRVLFKTNSFPNPNQWNDDFNSLSAELINDLAARGVILVGIDTPSIDPATQKDLSSHHAIYKNDMAILEGIILENISSGVYELIALPLRIEGADASPVRAILIEKDN